MIGDALTLIRAWRLRSQLRQRLRWTAEQLRAYQLSAIQQLVRHAYDHTVLYRRLYDAAGIRPEDIRSLEDFASLPIVDKRTLRDAFPRDVIARTHRTSKLIPGATGGSTGEPLRFVLDRDTAAHKIAGNLRSMELAGYRPGRDRLVQTSPDAGMVQGLMRRLGAGLLRRHCLDPFRPDWAAALADIQRLQPAVLVGWTSYLRTLAECLLAAGQHLPVRLVLTTSEALHAADRELMTQAYAAPVFDQYGSTEFGRVATEYPGGRGLLVHADLTFVETAGRYPSEQGEMGELILTSLVNYAMPFIRYRIGDLGRLSREPAVGFPAYPVLEQLGGRVQDMLLRSDGSWIVPEFIHRVLREYDEIDRYQVLQHSPTRLELKLRLRRPLSADRAEAVRSQLAEYLGQIVMTVSCDGPFAVSGGKHRPIVSRLYDSEGNSP